MNTIIFKTKLLPDGHLYCPKELAQKENATFKVIVEFEDDEIQVSEYDVEQSASIDISSDVLSEEEVHYYLNLKEL